MRKFVFSTFSSYFTLLSSFFKNALWKHCLQTCIHLRLNHTHIHTHTLIYIYVCVCVCVCVCIDRKKERERELKNLETLKTLAQMK